MIAIIAVSLTLVTAVGLIIEEPIHRWWIGRKLKRMGRRELVVHQQMLDSAATNYHLVTKAEMLMKQLLDADPLDVHLSEKYEERVKSLLRQITGDSKGDK